MDIKKIYYKHYRYTKWDNNEFMYHYSRRSKEFQPTAMGGKTECHLVLTDDSEIVGIAECSLQQNFNYRLGRTISYGRAMKKYRQWLTQIEAQKADLQFVYTVV